MLEESLRVRQKQVHSLENQVAEKEETVQNLNRLLDQQERALSAFGDMVRLFSVGRTVREVAGKFVELAIRAMRCEAAVLGIREGKETHICLVAAVGDRADAIHNQLFGENEGIIGTVTKTGEPLMIPDGKREARLKNEGPDYIQREPRNALCVPVPGSSRAWGAVLLVNTRDRKRFNKGDMDLMTTMSLRLGQEMDRSAESGAARGEAARFQTLLRIGEVLHAAQDANRINEMVVQLSQRMVKSQGAAIFALDDRVQALVCAASSEKQSRPVNVPIGMGVAGWVALQGQAVSTDIETDARFSGQFEPLFTFRVRNVLAVPIRIGGRVTGVLEVVNKAGPQAYDDTDSSILTMLVREAGIALDNVNRLVESRKTINELLKGLSRYIDAKAPYLVGHSERVARMSHLLGEEMGLPPDELEKLYMEGLLHDLGNVGVDDELLLRVGKLSEEELGRVRQHASIGAEILRDVGALRHLMAGPLYHHERFDGTGYPHGLAGEQIPLHARIVGVAEAYDALRSARPYRPALPAGEAMAKVREGVGTMFDSRVVDALLRAYQRGRMNA